MPETLEHYFESPEFKNLLNRYESWDTPGKSPEYFDADHFLDLIDYYQMQEDFPAALLASERGLSQHPHDPLLTAFRVSLLVMARDFAKAEEVADDLGACDTDLAFYVEGQLYLARDGDVETAETYFRQWVSLLLWVYKQSLKEDRATGIESAYTLNRPEYMDAVSGLDLPEGFEPEGELTKLDEGFLRTYRKESMTDDEGEYATPETDESEHRLREAYIRIVCSYLELPEEMNREMAYLWLFRYIYRFGFNGQNSQDDIVLSAADRGGFVQLEERLLQKALDESPYMEGGWKMLASTQCRMGRYQAALNAVEFALAVDGGDTEAEEIKALCLYQLGRYQEAADVYERLNKRQSSWFFLISMVKCYMKLRKAEKAEQVTDQLWFYANLELREKLERSKRGEKLDKRVRDSVQSIFSQIADCYIQFGAFDKAVEVLELVVSHLHIYSEDADSLKLIRCAYCSGDVHKAKQLVRQVVEDVSCNTWMTMQVLDVVGQVMPEETLETLKRTMEYDLEHGFDENYLSTVYHCYTRIVIHALNAGQEEQARLYAVRARQYDLDFLCETFPSAGLDTCGYMESLDRIVACLKERLSEFHRDFVHPVIMHRTDVLKYEEDDDDAGEDEDGDDSPEAFSPEA